MITRRTIGLAVVLAFSAPWAFRAQVSIEPRAKSRPKEETPPPNLRVDTSLVLVPVTVSDALNRPVSGMERENFRVFEDKVEQKITQFSMEDDPIALGLVFDSSGSMGGVLKEARQAAAVFFKTADVGDEFFLVEFDTAPHLLVPLSRDVEEIDYQIMFSKSRGSTALLDGVYLALNEIRKSKKLRKALILVSDGGENNSRYTAAEVRNGMRETDVLIYPILIGGEPGGPQLMNQFAEQTGGRMFVANRVSLADIAQKIVVDLRNRYVLGYSPANKARDGKYRRIEVKLVPPKGVGQLTAHWRQGYFAPQN